MTRNFLKAREYIVMFAFAISMIICGSFVDLQFSKSVYDATNTNMFGVVMSGLAEMPPYLATSVAGMLLIVSAKETKTIWKVLSWIAGIAAIAFGAFYSWHTFCNIYEFKNTASAELVVKILGAVFTVIILGLSGYFVFTKCAKKDRSVVRNIGIAILCIVVIELAIATAGKFIFSRPRPRFLIDGFGVEEQFKNWWEVRPFKCNELAKLHGIESDNWKSCPSGHSATAIVMAFALPLFTLLNDDYKNNYKARLIAFYIGLTWGLVSALSRIYAGAHFLSDVGIGLLITSLTGLLTQLILPLILKD